MKTFFAVFRNLQGLRLTLHFTNENWNGVEDAAWSKFHETSEHDHLGPWTIVIIDTSR